MNEQTQTTWTPVVAWLEDANGERCSTVVPCHTETRPSDNGPTTVAVILDEQFALTNGMAFVTQVVFGDDEGKQHRVEVGLKRNKDPRPKAGVWLRTNG